MEIYSLECNTPIENGNRSLYNAKKKNYKWPFSIVMLNYQRVCWFATCANRDLWWIYLEFDGVINQLITGGAYTVETSMEKIQPWRALSQARSGLASVQFFFPHQDPVEMSFKKTWGFSHHFPSKTHETGRSERFQHPVYLHSSFHKWRWMAKMDNKLSIVHSIIHIEYSVCVNYTHICIYIYMCARMYEHMYICICVYINICTYTHT